MCIFRMESPLHIAPLVNEPVSVRLLLPSTEPYIVNNEGKLVVGLHRIAAASIN